MAVEAKPVPTSKSGFKVSRNYLVWFYGIILFLTSLLITGYRIYYGNQAITIPLILSVNDPTLFPNDPFVSTLVNYAAPIWRLLAIPAKSISIEIIFLFFFLFARALMIFASGYLANTISPRNILAVVGVMAFFATWPISVIGHGTILSTYFEQTSLSLGFFLLAAAAFYSKRKYLWAVWMAIGFSLNSMYGTYASTYFAAVFLLDPEYRKSWRLWLVPFALLGLLILPVVLLTLSAFRIDTVARELWLLASKARFTMHLYPHTWHPAEIYIFFGYVIFTSVVFYLLRKENKKLFIYGLIWLLVLLGWVAYTYLAAYWAESPSMLVMHPARATDIWFILVGTSVITLCAQKISNVKANKPAYIVLFFICITWQKAIDDFLIIVSFWVIIAILAYWHPTWKHILKSGSEARLSAVVVLVAVLFGIFVFSQEPHSFKFANLVRYPDEEIIEISKWAKENTEKGDLFLVDPNWSDFRSLAMRPVYVTYKDGAAILWERSYVEQWVPRMESVGYDFYNPEAVGISTHPYMKFVLSYFYDELDDQKVRELARLYPLRYWVTATDHVSDFPIAYRTSEFKVLDIQSLID
ncbi:MAG: DUF6798 domain-containing protein [Anaerolineales bacterium]